MSPSGRAALALILGACLPARVVAQQSDTTASAAVTRSVYSGIYSTAQARRGEAVFRAACGDCHAIAQFRDSTFRRTWSGRTARDLFEMIRTQMPQDNPGGLRRDEYGAVLAYIFELSGFPPGEGDLPSDDAGLRSVRIDPRPPEPRP